MASNFNEIIEFSKANCNEYRVVNHHPKFGNIDKTRFIVKTQ